MGIWTREKDRVPNGNDRNKRLVAASVFDTVKLRKPRVSASGAGESWHRAVKPG